MHAHLNPLRLPKVFNLSKAPLNYCEAKARPDTNIWRTVMQRELDTLCDQEVFQPTTLPYNCKAISTRWVYTYKLHPDGSIIHSKEKARLVVQGFSQQPEGFGETYTLVTKMTSIRIVLTFTAAEDYEVLCYNVKSALPQAN